MKVQYQGSVREADPFPWRRTWKYKCLHFTSSVQGKSSDCDLYENQSPLLNFPGNGLHKNLRSKPLGIAIKKEHAFDYQLWSGIWEAASIGGKERRKHTPQGVAHARSLGERPAPGEDEWGASPAASAATHPDRWHRSSSNGPWGRHSHRRNFIWEFKVLKKYDFWRQKKNKTTSCLLFLNWIGAFVLWQWSQKVSPCSVSQVHPAFHTSLWLNVEILPRVPKPDIWTRMKQAEVAVIAQKRELKIHKCENI